MCLGRFEPSDRYPAAQLVKQSFYFGDSVKIIPEECEGKQTQMGGNYAATSDSRFSDAIVNTTWTQLLWCSTNSR